MDTVRLRLFEMTFLTILTPNVLCLLVCPFYVYVNKLNQRRNREALFYPITYHFYKMVIFSYWAFWFSIISVIISLFSYFNPYSGSQILLAISSLSVCFLIFILFLIAQVFYLFIFVLAVVKFLLYFYPETKALISVFLKKLPIFYIYLFFSVKEIFNIASKLTYDKHGNTMLVIINNVFHTGVFIALYVSTFLAALLYIPILLHARKFSYLQSSKLNNPQKYIFLQTFVILIFKLLSIPLVVPWLSFGCSVLNLKYIFMIIDIIVTPNIVQVSYLLCNKRNLKALLSSFDLLKSVKTVTGFQKGSVVEPVVRSTIASGKILL
ncbi:hypothetical protein CAEBREN_21811 [Caenorhabditis brenneri]|uniref:Serpentine Receptor, class Z n=1 Tax=Caenorhabditis brenneri TaxID=135651 RepID=G0NQ80_CAEBE|nr:hypothetical protein CAEBREN_21811 [Caenorhabditis brenneri]